jgi:hypothetical protein
MRFKLIDTRYCYGLWDWPWHRRGLYDRVSKRVIDSADDIQVPLRREQVQEEW